MSTALLYTSIKSIYIIDIIGVSASQGIKLVRGLGILRPLSILLPSLTLNSLLLLIEAINNLNYYLVYTTIFKE